jgi:hypothetical protein
MTANRSLDSAPEAYAWPLVLCLVGVDYFSTLAYLPSIAVQAAGPLAPVAAGGVILVTFLLALPVYWYVVGRAPDGRGATGLFETLISGWRGKLVVLTMLGFAAADFVITRSLSLADAAVHLIQNQHGQKWLTRLPQDLLLDGETLWPPLERLLRVLIEPQMFITLALSILSFGLWYVLRHGFTRRILLATTVAVSCYLALTAIVIGSALVYLAGQPGICESWWQGLFQVPLAEGQTAANDGAWRWAWLSACLWSFPQMALGLSGFEMIMTVAPRVKGMRYTDGLKGRVRNTRKLMLAAAAIMAVYMLSAVVVTTLLVPSAELLPGGAAEHRALAYLAHGSPLANGTGEGLPSSLLGETFGDLFDFSTVMILVLAGASVTIGLQNLLPHYLNRLGMEMSWAGKVGAILHVLNMVVLLVTVVFRASPTSQQWAYATSVLALLAGAALAAAKDLGRLPAPGFARWLLVALACGAGGFFLAMTGLTVLINHSGLTIALAFVVAILVSSFVSRWIRSTELRFQGFEFANKATSVRWRELGHSGSKVLVPHRPGILTLLERNEFLRRDYLLDPATPVIFVEAFVGDPSNFYQRPLMEIVRDEGLEVIRVSRCVSVSHVLAAVCLELCLDGGTPPQIIFGWSNEPPLAANLNFLLLGEGNIPWMVKELVRNAVSDPERQPRVVIG